MVSKKHEDVLYAPKENINWKKQREDDYNSPRICYKGKNTYSYLIMFALNIIWNITKELIKVFVRVAGWGNQKEEKSFQ